MVGSYDQTKRRYFILIVFIGLFVASCSTHEKRSFDSEGRLRSILRYNKKMLHGNCVWFYEHGGKQMEAEYVKNKLHGKQLRYHENGNLASVSFFDYDLRDSISAYYSQNAKLIHIENFQSDTLNGVNQRFYETGQLMVDGYYKNGMMHGSWLFYDVSGRITAKAEFNEGKGTQKAWHTNGKLSRVINYEGNMRHGTETFYNFDGKPEKIKTYQWDQLTNEELLRMP